MIIAGDCNSRTIEWSMTTTNFRCRQVLDTAAKLGLLVENKGSSTTFRRPGYIGSTPYVTLVLDGLSATLTHWRVLEEFTVSGHQHIMFRMVNKSGQNQRKKE